MDRSNQLVVVLTRSFATGVGVIRSLGAAGYMVDVIASARMPGLTGFIQKSKYVHEFKEVISPKFHADDETDEALREALLSYRDRYDDKPVLFPTDDYTASIMDENREDLEEIFLMPGIAGGGNGSMIRAMDKDFQGHLAKEAEILTPQEWIVPLGGAALKIPEDMVYPCFVKPIESITGYKSEMAVCKTKADLRKHLTRLRNKRPNRSVLVQEFLKIEEEIDLSGVCIDQQIIIPAIIRKTCVAKYEKGVTLSGMIYPFEWLEENCPKIVEMMQHFHYTGMFDMEFNIANGGQVYFNEVNLRSGGPNFAYFKSGANLPAVTVDEIVWGTHDPAMAEVDRYGSNFIYEKVAWEDYLHGFMTRQVLDRRMNDADFGLLYSEEDPGPYLDKYNEFQTTENNRIREEKRKAFANKTYNRPIIRKLRKKLKALKRKIRRWFRQNRLARWLRQRKLRRQRIKDGYPQIKAENKRKRFNRRPRVMVAGRNYCSNLSIARSLGEAGYEVEILHVYQTLPGKDEPLRGIEVDRLSKYVKAYYIAVTKREDKTLLDELIKKANKQVKMLLVPADDLVASVADQYYDKLKPYYIMPNVADTQGEINRMMCKGVQKELARAAGLPVLGSCVIVAEGGVFTIPDTVTYPCFIKPNVSRLAAKSRMHRCDTKEELAGWLTVFSERRRIEMLVEDYAEIVNEYSILGVSTKKGAIGPAAFVAVKGGSAEHRGVALTGKILPLSEMQPLADQLIDFMGSLNFDGLYDIDLVETADGTIYFVEINMRLGASGYAFTRCGVNLPGIFADYMLYRKPVDRNLQVKDPGKIFVSEKVLIDEYAGGRIEKEDYEQIMKEADLFFIRNEEDPEPYNKFKTYFKVAADLRQKLSQSEEVPLTAQPLEERLGTVNDRAVALVMKKTFWSDKKARRVMDEAYAEHGVTYVDYARRSLFMIPQEELGDYLKDQEILREQRERSLVSVMEKTGWNRQQALSRMQTASRTTGASFTFYDRTNMWKVPVKKQKDYVTILVRTGCTEEEYYRYKMGIRKPVVRNRIFLNALSYQLEERYNTDERFLETLASPEKFYRTFRQFIRRAWALNTRLRPNQFAELFEGCSQVIYRPLDPADRNLVIFNVTPENAGAVCEHLTQMAPGMVEECLTQHEALEALSPGAMVKLRIVTVSSKDQPVTEDGPMSDIAYVILRVGGEEGQAHQFYNGEYNMVVDKETGIVISAGVTADCHRRLTQPVSRVTFNGFQVPMFEEALELVQTAMERCRVYGYLGWDLVITDQRPVLVGITDRPAPALVSAPYLLKKSGVRGIRPRMREYLWEPPVEETEAAEADTDTDVKHTEVTE